MSTPIRLPLDFDIESRSASTAKDARLVNAYVESNKTKKSIRKRPGLSLYSLGTGSGQGIYNFNNNLISGANSKINRIGSSQTIGMTWNTPTTSNITGGWLVTDIAYGNGVYVAVGNAAGGVATTISYSSTDGITWTARTIPSSTWSSVAWNGTVFCAITSNGNIAATSPDGITWTQRTLSASLVWRRLIYANGLFVAIATGSSTASTSPDGITWTSRTLPSIQNWSDISWNGTLFCVIAQGTNSTATSTDGITWTARTISTSTNWDSIYWNGVVFCALAYSTSTYATSPDGITWTTRTFPIVLGTSTSISAVGTGFCVVSLGSNSTYISNDAITWTLVSISGATGSWGALSNNGSQFVTIDRSSTALIANSSSSSLILSQIPFGSIASGPLFFTQTQTKPYCFVSNGTNSYTIDGSVNPPTISAITNDKVVSLLLNAGGGGLTPGTGNLVFTGGSPTVAATGTYTVSSAGILTSVTLTSGGIGYTSTPTVTIPGSAVSTPAIFDGKIQGNQLTVLKMFSGTLSVGSPVSGLGTVSGNLPRIASMATGTNGGVGTYTLNNAVSSGVNGVVTPNELYNIPVTGAIFTASISGNTLTVTAVSQGSINTNIPNAGTYTGTGTFNKITFLNNGIPTFVSIIANGTGTGGTGTYTLDTSFTTPVTSTTMYAGWRDGGARTLLSAFIGCAGSDGASSITATLNAFPTETLAIGAVYLDNTVYVMTTSGKIYNSGVEDPNTWNALNYLQKSSEPDGGVALAKNMNWILAFGKWSMEVFWDNANATGSPLSRDDSGKQEIGCANGWSVTSFSDTVMYVGQTRQSGRGVYMIENKFPQKVSNASIEQYLNADAMVNVRAYPVSIAGHYFYILQLKDSGYTFVYDLNTKLWYQWTSDSSGIDSIFKGMFGASIGNTQYIQDETDGTIYTISTTAYQDQLSTGVASPINLRAVTSLIDGGTNLRKFYASLELIGDRVSANVQVRYSDDDYQTWSAYRAVDMSQPRPVIYQLGEARRRAYEFYCTDNQPIRIDEVEFNVQSGDS